MASQGPRYPTATASLANAGTSEDANPWVTPENIGADDGSEAQIVAPSYDTPDISELLIGSNFGFTIPAGATINGITVEIDRRCFAGTAEDFRLQLATGTTFADLVGDNKGDPNSNWPATLTVRSYGGVTDTWNAGLTVAQINASGFAVMVSVRANLANTDIGVDFIRVTVDYTAAPAETADAITATSTGSALTSGKTIAAGGAGVAVASVGEAATYSETILGEPSVASYWRLGEASGNVIDAAGSNDMEITNGPTYGATGLLVDDADDAITFNAAFAQAGTDNTPSGLPTGNNPWTMEAWIATTAVTSGDVIGWGVGTGNQDVALRITSAGALAFTSHSEANTFGGDVNDGSPHHVVLTYDGTLMKGYIDGSQIGTAWDLTNPIALGTGGLHVAVWVSYFTGTIDEAAIYSSALSGTAIANHYAVGTGTAPVGMPRAWVNIGATALVASGTGAALNVTAQTSGASEQADAITATATGTALNVTAQTSEPTYEDLILGDSPIGYWRLGETSGTLAEDIAGTNDGTYTGGYTQNVTALISDADGAVRLDGVTGTYVALPDIDQGSGPLTWEAWFRKDNAARQEIIIGKGTGQIAVYTTTGNDLVVSIHGAGPVMTIALANPTSIHHLVTTKDTGSTAWKLYLDGQDVTPTVTARTMTDNAYSIRVGQDFDTTDPFDGVIDEVAIYSSVLTLTQVQEHYAKGAGAPQFNAGVAAATAAALDATAETAGASVEANAITATATGSAANATAIANVAEVLYGSAVNMESLNNTQIGGSSLTTASDRFRAEQSSSVKTVRIYWIDETHPGYGGGTGGSFRVEIRPDDGTGIPSDTVLGYVDIGSPSDNAGLLISFDPPIPVTEGQRYHIVFRNIDANPDVNFCSTDNIYTYTVINPRQPGKSNDDYAECRKYGAQAWFVHDKNTPLIDIAYVNGAHQGNGYMELEITNAAIIQGTNNMARERFTVAGSNRVVVGAAIYGRRSFGTEPLVVRLEESDGTLIDSFTIPYTAFDPAAEPGDNAGSDWGSGVFSQSRTLQAGSTYNLRLSTGADTKYTHTGIQQGESYGYDPATYFDDGAMQATTNGIDWSYITGMSTDGDLQFYLIARGIVEAHTANAVGAALDATAQTTGATQANAGVATATGAASPSSAVIGAMAGLGTITGQAAQPSGSIGATPGLGTITSQALASNAGVGAIAGAGTSNASAGLVTSSIQVNGPASVATLSALDATAEVTQAAVEANAGVATITAVAYPVGMPQLAPPSVAIGAHPLLASATGAARDATAEVEGMVVFNADVATASGAALGATTQIVAVGGIGTAIGAALNATAQTTVATYADAGVATATASANGPTAAIVATIGSGAAALVAQVAGIAVEPRAGVASSTIAAYSPTSLVAPTAPAATITGSAINATVQIQGQTNALAGVATATGAVLAPHVAESVIAGTSSVTAVALDASATSQKIVTAGVASAAGSTSGPSTRVESAPSTAEAIAAAWGAVVQTETNVQVQPETATVTGAALNASVVAIPYRTATAETAIASATVLDPATSLAALIGSAAASAAARDATGLSAYAQGIDAEMYIGMGHRDPLVTSDRPPFTTSDQQRPHIRRP